MDSIGAVDKMTAGDGSMLIQHQLAVTVGLMEEVPINAQRMSGDPIASSDGGMASELQ
jgi:hypothetical protein